MIHVKVGDVWFNHRVAGVAIEDGQVLLHRGERDDFWTLPGGRVEPGEDSRSALVREMEEELVAAVEVERLLWVVENFFEYRGRPYHELALVHRMHFAPGNPVSGRQGEWEREEEEEERLIFCWAPLKELGAWRLLPDFMGEKLQHLPKGPEHVIHADEA